MNDNRANDSVRREIADFVARHFSEPRHEPRSIEEQLASREAELNVASDQATEHAMWRYYLEDELERNQKELAAANERLAEVRDAAEAYIKQVTGGAPIACFATQEAENYLRQILRSAPAGGQALWRGTGTLLVEKGYGFDIGDEPCSCVPDLSGGAELVIPDEVGTNGLSIEVLLREIPCSD
jgi:hypothetical protein